MITGIHHVKITIPVGAEAQARAFYCQLLGLPEVPKPPELSGRGGLWVRAGTTTIYLAVQSGIDRAALKNHIGYAVSDLQSWRERLLAAGVEVRQSLPVTGHERFECSDPFGNRIELQQS